MNAPARLAIYAAGLVVAFGSAFAIAGAVVPDSFVTEWMHTGGDTQTHPEVSD